MRVLVAPDKFKGSLSAADVARAIQRGWCRVDPAVEWDLAPIADGGEGFAEALAAASPGGGWVRVGVKDPLGRLVEGRYYRMGDGQVVLDMSEASGLWRLGSQERNPLKASTYGTGELIRHAVENGAIGVLIGLGGSATNDGGMGMAAALGYQFLDSGGAELEAVPENLAKLAGLRRPEGFGMPPVWAACDVGNPLLGERGATRVYGPQKGVGEAEMEVLETGLDRLAEVVRDSFGVDHRSEPGAGAAGGIGFGLLSFCGANLRSGFELVSEALNLRQRMEGSDLVVTGEGRLDGQTLEGKGPAGVAALARKCGKKVVAFAGSIGEEAEGAFDMTVPIVDRVVTLEEAMGRGAEFLERAAWRTARMFAGFKNL
jgi:glycerate kinase